MKCKLMSLLVVLGLIGCKADTGTVMYVVNAPLPSDECVFEETGKEVRFGGFFDPTLAPSMMTIFRVHNGLNPKETDQRVDDNGVNVRPDGNHIQLEKALVCYYNGDDVAAAQDHVCDDTVAECKAPDFNEEFEATAPCKQTIPVFTVLPADGSAVDEGKLVELKMLDADALGALLSANDAVEDGGQFRYFNADTIALARDLHSSGSDGVVGTTDDVNVNQYVNCRAPGVGIPSPGGDPDCIGATSTELSAMAVVSDHAGQIVRGYGPKQTYPSAVGVDDEHWGPKDTFGSEDALVQSAKILAKVRFIGRTVSGAAVESGSFIFPVDVCPGCVTQASISSYAGSCVTSKVMCEAQARCKYLDSAAGTMTGTCVTGSSEGKEKYHDGCLLGNGSTFSYVQVDDDNNPVTADIDVPTDTALIPCKFGIAGAQPQYSGCLPDQFLGKVEEYTCAPVDTCEEITTVEIADRCGDGLVADTEECDDGNITAGDGCDDKCEEE